METADNRHYVEDPKAPGGWREVSDAERAEIAKWGIRNFRTAMTTRDQRPPWVIEDLLLGDSATLVSAQPHCMKSLSLLCACLEAVTTHRVWGHFEAPKVERVLFVETEDPTWMVQARIRGFAQGLRIDPGADVPGFYYSCMGPFDLEKEEHRIKRLFDSYRPQFMVLSTLQNLLRGKDWKSQEDMQPIMAAIIRLSRECPIILVTHSPWDKRQRRAAGTVTQTANFLTTLHYEKTVSRGETFVHAVVDSKAGAADTDFSLKLETAGDPRDPGSVRRIVYAGPGWPRGTGKDAVIAELSTHPEDSSEKIAERTGVSLRYVQQIKAKLGTAVERGPDE